MALNRVDDIWRVLVLIGKRFLRSFDFEFDRKPKEPWEGLSQNLARRCLMLDLKYREMVKEVVGGLRETMKGRDKKVEAQALS